MCWPKTPSGDVWTKHFFGCGHNNLTLRNSQLIVAGEKYVKWQLFDNCQLPVDSCHLPTSTNKNKKRPLLLAAKAKNMENGVFYQPDSRACCSVHLWICEYPLLWINTTLPWINNPPPPPLDEYSWDVDCERGTHRFLIHGCRLGKIRFSPGTPSMY